MFKSATLKLTGWYLLILMVISVLFSFAIYQSTSHEFNFRFERLQNNFRFEPGFKPDPNRQLTLLESDQASSRLIVNLIYANTAILVGGGFISFLLAKRTLRPIEEAHDAQKRFTSDASHELRTPLAAMKSELEVALRDEGTTKEDLRSVVRSSIEEVDKLTRLSEMLLNLSRLDHDKLELTAVDVYDIVQEVVKLYNKTNPRVTIKTAAHPFVYGNEAALRELICTIVDNALKYSPEDSKVTIKIASKGRQAVIGIKNSGPGISSEALPHIFERFYQADNARSSHVDKGYGLGLALAKKIVELHKGELSVESTPGEFTVFIISLPLVQNNPSKI